MQPRGFGSHSSAKDVSLERGQYVLKLLYAPELSNDIVPKFFLL